MERKKWLLMPMVMNFVSVFLTELLVPNYPQFVEANPIARTLFSVFGSFYVVLIISGFFILYLTPKFCDWLIRHTEQGETHRNQFEWLLIGMFSVALSIDMINNLVVFFSS